MDGIWGVSYFSGFSSCVVDLLVMRAGGCVAPPMAVCLFFMGMELNILYFLIVSLLFAVKGER